MLRRMDLTRPGGNVQAKNHSSGRGKIVVKKSIAGATNRKIKTEFAFQISANSVSPKREKYFNGVRRRARRHQIWHHHSRRRARLRHSRRRARRKRARRPNNHPSQTTAIHSDNSNKPDNNTADNSNKAGSNKPSPARFEHRSPSKRVPLFVWQARRGGGGGGWGAAS